jgi:hypothetical protein
LSPVITIASLMLVVLVLFGGYFIAATLHDYLRYGEYVLPLCNQYVCVRIDSTCLSVGTVSAVSNCRTMRERVEQALSYHVEEHVDATEAYNITADDPLARARLFAATFGRRDRDTMAGWPQGPQINRVIFLGGATVYHMALLLQSRGTLSRLWPRAKYTYMRAP